MTNNSVTDPHAIRSHSVTGPDYARSPESDATRLRVAILLPCLIFGGAERVALTLARALTALGCRVSILLLSQQGELVAEAQREWSVVDLRCDRTKNLPRCLAGYLAANPTDLLLSSFMKLNLCACIVRLRFPRLRLLLWEHGYPSKSENAHPLLYPVLASIFYQLATRVICVSQGVARDIIELTVGLKRKLTVINNPIPLPDAAPEASRDGVRRIAWVGRLSAVKNPCLMIDAFVLMAGQIDAELIFIGDGAMRAELEARSAQSGYAERIKFAGFQANPHEILADCDVLVSTSRREGFGNVLVEAMHLGLSVVSTDSGGVDDILGPSLYGSIVKFGDANALANAIIAELDCPRDRERQKQAAARFLPDVIATQFLAAAGLRRA